MIEFATSAMVLLSMFYGTAAASTKPVEYQSPQVTIQDRNIIDDMALHATSAHTKNVEIAVREYFADTPILAEIAKCESQFRHIGESGKIIRGKVNREDIGVMQINTFYHDEEADKLDIDLYTLAGNMAYAKVLYDKYGTSPWSSSAPCWNKYVAISQK